MILPILAPLPPHCQKSDHHKSLSESHRNGQEEETEGPRCCWVCLGESSEEGEPPVRALCRCPTRFAHDACLGRWQLQQAGKR